MSKLTIVLTLKDGQEFTRRWMRYMNDQGCPHKILIADGGADEAIEMQLRDARHYPNLDYEYIRYPYDKDFRTFYSKQLDVCERVETEYLLLADNDDFYLNDKIPSLIDFLDRNPDYSGCRGAVARFSLISRDGAVINAPTGEFYRADHHEGRTIDNEKFVERIEAFFNGLVQYDHWQNWYCIYRSKKVVSSLRTIYKYNFSDVVLNEILFSLLLLREGKIKIAEPLFYARQMGSSQLEAELLVKNNVLEWFVINDVFHCFNEFILSEGFTSEENERVRILKAFANYVGTWCNLCSDKYRSGNIAQRVAHSIRMLLKQNRGLYQLIHWSVLRYSHMLTGTRKRHAIRIPAIESYILGG